MTEGPNGPPMYVEFWNYWKSEEYAPPLMAKWERECIARAKRAFKHGISSVMMVSETGSEPEYRGVRLILGVAEE
jgi:hypothetical protein